MPSAGSGLEPAPTVSVTSAPLREVEGADVLAVGFRSVDGAFVVGDQADDAAALLPATVADVLTRSRARGTVGEVLEVPVYGDESPVTSVLLVGLGNGTAADVRRGGAALARKVRGRTHIAVALGADCLGGDPPAERGGQRFSSSVLRPRGPRRSTGSRRRRRP